MRTASFDAKLFAVRDKRHQLLGESVEFESGDSLRPKARQTWGLPFPIVRLVII
jgi:hypothetical protein